MSGISSIGNSSLSIKSLSPAWQVKADPDGYKTAAEQLTHPAAKTTESDSVLINRAHTPVMQVIAGDEFVRTGNKKQQAIEQQPKPLRTKDVTKSLIV